MKRYWILAGGLFFTFLLLFLLVEALGVPLLADPSPWLRHGGWVAALVGVGLLVADVFLPIPSSLVMIAHGALFGVGVGFLLSLTGSVGAALVGFAVGRRGGALLERLVPREERARADLLLLRWGALAVLVTRPVPLMAETVAILAGASPLGWGRLTLAAVAGSLPGALLYAVAGAMAVDFQSGVLVLGLVLLVAAFFYAISRWIGLRVAGS
jgi:uncharacterized membrane protein YdjX (TVP38/TMEM64 family)